MKVKKIKNIVKTKLNKLKKKLTPKSFLRQDLYKRTEPLNFPKKRKKIPKDEFMIPDFKDFNLLLEKNYNVSQLRSICKHYKQRRSGNKTQLIQLLYNYLRYSYYVLKIQRIFRGYLIRELDKKRGPGFNNLKKCVNETDFYTLENLKELPKNQIISYKDVDNFVYGFDICSLYNMIAVEGSNINPYNRKEMPLSLLDDIKRIVRLSKVLNKDINIILENDISSLTKEKQRELRAISIFQKIDEHGFITDANWFLNLNRQGLKKYLRELLDVWQYRLQINNDTKFKINPQYGNPFFSFNIPILLTKCREVLQNRLLDLIEIFITKGIDEDARNCGMYYVLGTLTIVSNNAANALPWLYSTFRPND